MSTCRPNPPATCDSRRVWPAPSFESSFSACPLRWAVHWLMTDCHLDWSVLPSSKGCSSPGCHLESKGRSAMGWLPARMLGSRSTQLKETEQVMRMFLECSCADCARGNAVESSGFGYRLSVIRPRQNKQPNSE